MCFFPFPLLHPPTDPPETLPELDRPWVCSSTAALNNCRGIPIWGSSSSRQRSHLTAAQQDPQSPVFAILNHPGVTMESKRQDPHADSAGELCGRDQLWAAPESLPAPTALQPLGRGPVLPKLSPFLGHSEHPEGLNVCQEFAAGSCCASILGQCCVSLIHVRSALHVLSFHLLAWMQTPAPRSWMRQPPLNGSPRPSPSAFSLSHGHAQVCQAREPPAEPPPWAHCCTPNTCLRATSLAPLPRGAHTRHAKVSTRIGGTDIPADRAGVPQVPQQLQPCGQCHAPPWLQGAGCRDAELPAAEQGP